MTECEPILQVAQGCSISSRPDHLGVRPPMGAVPQHQQPGLQHQFMLGQQAHIGCIWRTGGGAAAIDVVFVLIVWMFWGDCHPGRRRFHCVR